MKQQREVIVGPHTFQVPARIQRCPGGWQVRYLGTRWFADGADGPGRSLKAAHAELRTRYARKPPAPIGGPRTAPLQHKRSDLPAGISGPVVAIRPNRAPYYEFKVSLPRRGKPNGGTSVYIATEAGWSDERYAQALAKAIRRRAAAVERARPRASAGQVIASGSAFGPRC